MKTACIKCGAEWGEDSQEEHLSHGLCSECFRELVRPIYRQRQRAEGNFDCFGTALGYCDQAQCLYRRYCVTTEEQEHGR
jgi:hypothetical protein